MSSSSTPGHSMRTKRRIPLPFSSSLSKTFTSGRLL
jgi:hypothetical protein